MSYNANSWKERLLQLIDPKVKQRVIAVSWEARSMLLPAEREKIANLFNTLAAIFTGE